MPLFAGKYYWLTEKLCKETCEEEELQEKLTAKEDKEPEAGAKVEARCVQIEECACGAQGN